jgi:hypothetical protein
MSGKGVFRGSAVRPALEKPNRAPPIGDLLPRVDVAALCTIARPEIAMIMEEHDETGFREGPCESFEA